MAAVAMVHSIYPGYDPRAGQYGFYSPNNAPSVIGQYGQYASSYAANPFGPYAAQGFNMPAPYMNPYAAPGFQMHPAPGFNMYPAPASYPYSAPGPVGSPRKSEAVPYRLSGYRPYAGEENLSRGDPSYEDLQALVRHRLPGFFGKHEHRLLWSPELKYPPKGEVQGKEPGPMPEPPGPDEYVEPDFPSPEPISTTEAPNPREDRGPPPVMANPGPESNVNSSQTTNSEGHTIKKRYVKDSYAHGNDVSDPYHKEFNRFLELAENFSADELVKHYIHVLMHPKEIKYSQKYSESIARLIGHKYQIYITSSTVFEKYPQYASMEVHGTMKNSLQLDPHKMMTGGSAQQGGMKDGGSGQRQGFEYAGGSHWESPPTAGIYRASYFNKDNKGHVEWIGEINKKSFFGTKGSNSDAYKTEALIAKGAKPI